MNQPPTPGSRVTRLLADRPARGRAAGRWSWLLLAASLPAGATEPAEITYAEPELLGQLENQDISESSGLAPSRIRRGVFWTHNDSGDQPRVFAFDLLGRHLSRIDLRGAASLDWEDMASFTLDGRHYLLLADVGDNARRRDQYTLYLVQEPTGGDDSARLEAAIRFRYPDAAHNCEAVGVDPETRSVLLIAKALGSSPVYRLPLSWNGSPALQTAEKIAAVRLPWVTAMDVSADGRRAIVLTYTSAYEFRRQEDESWAEAFGRTPRELAMPARAQGESICYGEDGASLFLTSEKLPTPFWQIRAQPDS